MEERQAYLEEIVDQLNHRVITMEKKKKNKMNNGSQKLKWILRILRLEIRMDSGDSGDSGVGDMDGFCGWGYGFVSLLMGFSHH